MKKLLLFLYATLLFGSDAVTIDSLFKKQLGLRSVTNLSFLSSGNPNVYTSYPDLLINGDPVVWSDTKQLSLNQTFMYALSSKLDVLTSFGGNFTRSEYISYTTLEPKHKNRASFDSVWLGLNYKADKWGDLVPMITFQSAIYQKERAKFKDKELNFKSHSLKFSLKGYSDPVVYSLNFGGSCNAKRNFSFATIEYGNSVYFGGDLSIVLSPKITLDLGAQQRFQGEQKVNGKKVINVRSIPTYNVGSTYSINSDTSFTFSATFGGSSAAPDSIFGISLWQKF